MLLTDDAIKKMTDFIKENIYKMYSEFLSDIKINKTIDETIKKALLNIELNNGTNEESLYRSLYRTKCRWVKKEKEKKEGLYKDIEFCNKFYKSIDCDNKKFYIMYEVDNPTELRDKIIMELENWRRDRNGLLGNFKYINKRSKTVINSSAKTDINYLSHLFLKEYTNNERNISEMPNTMGYIPVDFTNRAVIKLNNSIDSNKEYFTDKYYINNNTVFESVVDTQILKTGIIQNAIKMLNSNDIQILLYLLSLRNEDFFTSRQIVTNIGDIVSNCCKSKGVKNYAMVKESLFKMQYFSTGAVDSYLRGFTIKLIDNIDIVKIGKKEVVTVLFNIDIVNDILNNRTTRMYRDVINNFELPQSKILIFGLQRKRVSLSLDVSKKTVYFNANLSFFRSVLYFSNKNKIKNLKDIESSLNEIKKSNITLHNFKRKNDNFELEFYPITEKEKIDLLML